MDELKLLKYARVRFRLACMKNKMFVFGYSSNYLISDLARHTFVAQIKLSLF